MVVIYHQLCHSHPILRVIGILDIWRWGRFSGKLNMLPVSRAIVLGCCLIHQMTKWLRESQDSNNTPLRMKYAKVKSKLAKNCWTKNPGADSIKKTFVTSANQATGFLDPLSDWWRAEGFPSRAAAQRPELAQSVSDITGPASASTADRSRQRLFVKNWGHRHNIMNTSWGEASY